MMNGWNLTSSWSSLGELFEALALGIIISELVLGVRWNEFLELNNL